MSNLNLHKLCEWVWLRQQTFKCTVNSDYSFGHYIVLYSVYYE